MGYLEPLQKGLDFGVNPLHWLPLLIVDLVFFSFAIGVISTPERVMALIELLVSHAPSAQLLGTVGWIAVIGVVWFLFRLWVTGALIHQSVRPKDWSKSWSVSWKRYPQLLLTVIVVAVLASVVGYVPLVGGMLSFVVSVVLFFVLQGVVLKKYRAGQAVTDSYRLFRRSLKQVEKHEHLLGAWMVIALALAVLITLVASGLGFRTVGFALVEAWITMAVVAFFILFSKVFRMWFFIALISGAIVLVFSLPALASAASFATPEMVDLGRGNVLATSVLFYLSNLPALYVMGLIVLVGSAISTAFSLKAQTEYYLQLKKKRLGLF